MDKMVIEMTRIATDGYESHMLTVPSNVAEKKFFEIVEATRAIGWDKMDRSRYGLPSVDFRVRDGYGWFEEVTLTLKMDWE